MGGIGIVIALLGGLVAAASASSSQRRAREAGAKDADARHEAEAKAKAEHDELVRAEVKKARADWLAEQRAAGKAGAE